MHREIYEVNLQSLCVGVKPFSPIEFALQIFGYFNMFFDSVGESFKLDKIPPMEVITDFISIEKVKELSTAINM